MAEHVKIQENGAVLEILFARPEKKNALSNAMYRAASDALESARTNNNTRVVLFGAEGDSFTVGNDLADFTAVATGASSELGAHTFLDQLSRTDKPIVAAVPGLAVGVGTTMLLHCDVVYLADGLSAQQAVALGLANKVLPTEEVLPAAREAARTLATRPLGAIVATKKLMRDRERVLAQMRNEEAIFRER